MLIWQHLYHGRFQMAFTHETARPNTGIAHAKVWIDLQAAIERTYQKARTSLYMSGILLWYLLTFCSSIFIIKDRPKPKQQPTPIPTKGQRIGKDSDYVGGKQLRDLDKKMQEVLPWGRRNKLVMNGHAVEHARRSALAGFKDNDWGRAWGEICRAAQNVQPVMPGAFGMLDLLLVPGHPNF